MVTLGCFVAAGILLGMLFNAYALAAACIAVAVANFALGAAVGIGQASISVLVGLVALQTGYVVGLLGFGLLHASKPASIPTPKV
jgi:hypothetical protein